MRLALLVHTAGKHPAKVGPWRFSVDAGMGGYISKPISADQLYKLIERFWGWLSPSPAKNPFVTAGHGAVVST